MTNREAAAIVERIRYYMEGGECWSPTEFKAMDMAIEALGSCDGCKLENDMCEVENGKTT